MSTKNWLLLPALALACASVSAQSLDEPLGASGPMAATPGSLPPGAPLPHGYAIDAQGRIFFVGGQRALNEPEPPSAALPPPPPPPAASPAPAAACTSANVGTVIGAVVGGLLGNTVGKGSGRGAALAVGAALGSAVGSHLGNPCRS